MERYKVALYTGIRKIEIRESEWTDPAPGYVTFKTFVTGTADMPQIFDRVSISFSQGKSMFRSS